MGTPNEDGLVNETASLDSVPKQDSESENINPENGKVSSNQFNDEEVSPPVSSDALAETFIASNESCNTSLTTAPDLIENPGDLSGVQETDKNTFVSTESSNNLQNSDNCSSFEITNSTTNENANETTSCEDIASESVNEKSEITCELKDDEEHTEETNETPSCKNIDGESFSEKSEIICELKDDKKLTDKISCENIDCESSSEIPSELKGDEKHTEETNETTSFENNESESVSEKSEIICELKDHEKLTDETTSCENIDSESVSEKSELKDEHEKCTDLKDAEVNSASTNHSAEECSNANIKFSKKTKEELNENSSINTGGEDIDVSTILQNPDENKDSTCSAADGASVDVNSFAASELSNDAIIDNNTSVDQNNIVKEIVSETKIQNIPICEMIEENLGDAEVTASSSINHNEEISVLIEKNILDELIEKVSKKEAVDMQNSNDATSPSAPQKEKKISSNFVNSKDTSDNASIEESKITDIAENDCVVNSKGRKLKNKKKVDSNTNISPKPTTNQNKSLNKSSSSKKKSCPKIKLSVEKSNENSSKSWIIQKRKYSSDSSNESIDSSNDSRRLSGRKRNSNFYISDRKKSADSKPPSVDEVTKQKDSLESKNSVTNHSEVETSADNCNQADSSIQDNNSIETSTVSDSCANISENLSFAPVMIKEEPIDIEDPLSESDYLSAASLNIKIETGVPEPSSTKGKKSRKSSKKQQSGPSLDLPNSLNIKIEPTDEEILVKKGNSKKSSTTSSPATPRQRSKNYSLEAVSTPFKMGWMRELVHRATDQKVGKKQSDVYYFSPEGKKLRSMPEISAYLSKHNITDLGLANFTFAKDCVYREPFEIERDAKHKSTIVSSFSAGKKSNPSTPKKTSTPPPPGTSKKQSSAKKSTPVRKRSKSENNELNPNNKLEQNSSKPVDLKISVSLPPKKRRKSEIANQLEKPNETQVNNTPVKKKRKSESDIQLEQPNEPQTNSIPTKKKTPVSKNSKSLTTKKTPVKSKTTLKRNSPVTPVSASEISDTSSGQQNISGVKLDILSQTDSVSLKKSNLNLSKSSNKQTKKPSIKKPLKVKFPFHKPRV